MKHKISIITALLVAGAISLNAQTNAPVVSTNGAGQVSVSPQSLPAQPGIAETLQSYLINNDTTFNGWSTNHFTAIEAVKFANVNGVPGASALGNVVGLEIPIHKWSVHFDTLVDFEQLFGDVHSLAVGVGYDYNIHQIHLSGGVDVQDVFTNNHVQAVPYVELMKMPTTLYGLAPFLRWQYPISRHPGGGEFLVGIGLNL